MSDVTPTELIAEARAKAVRVPGVVTMQEALADALEARLAENARLQAVITEAEERLGGMPVIEASSAKEPWVKVRISDVAEVREFLASAGSSSALEAVKADTTTEWTETTEYAYGSLEPPALICPTGEDIGDRATAEWNADEFWMKVLERTVRRSEWSPVETEGESRG